MSFTLHTISIFYCNILNPTLHFHSLSILSSQTSLAIFFSSHPGIYFSNFFFQVLKSSTLIPTYSNEGRHNCSTTFLRLPAQLTTFPLPIHALLFTVILQTCLMSPAVAVIHR